MKFKPGDRVRWGDGVAEVVMVEGDRVVCRTSDGLERITTVQSLSEHQPQTARRPRSTKCP
jgi:hypothetical protein